MMILYAPLTRYATSSGLDLVFILDTNVVSELRKIRLGRADKQFSKWADSMQTANLYLSVVTVQELEMGVLVLERHDAKQGAVFRT